MTWMAHFRYGNIIATACFQGAPGVRQSSYGAEYLLARRQCPDLRRIWSERWATTAKRLRLSGTQTGRPCGFGEVMKPATTSAHSYEKAWWSTQSAVAAHRRSRPAAAVMPSCKPEYWQLRENARCKSAGNLRRSQRCRRVDRRLLRQARADNRVHGEGALVQLLDDVQHRRIIRGGVKPPTQRGC